MESRLTMRSMVPMLAVALLASATTLGLMRLTAWAPRAAQASGQETLPVVRAQRFELVDASGAVTAIVGVDPSRNRPGLYLYDEHGTLRAAFGNVVIGGAYGFFIQNERGVARWVLGAGSGSGFAGFNVRDDAGTIRANIFATDDGAAAGVQTFDQDAKIRTQIGSFADAAPVVRILDADGQPIWQAP